MKRPIVVIVTLAAGAGLIWALMAFRNQPLEVQFVRVKRQDMHSSVPTNGKVEPIVWAAARAERAGAVQKIPVQRGQRVAQDAALLELDAADARADLAAAQARIAQIRGDLEVMERGGRATDLADIASQLERARFDLDTAQKDYATMQRLQTKQAVTALEVATAKERVDRAQLQIRSLEQRRAALVPTSDRTAADARLKEAEAAAGLAEQRIRQSVVRAPIEGVLYQFDIKPGAYLSVGETVGTIGRLDRVKVNVYVDEPDLGRVAKGMPVMITWDAQPGREWMGEVDSAATEVVTLGSRQVGEVACVIQNPDRDLLPGTNVNVQIEAQKAGSALTIPKEAVRTQNGKSGVLVLAGDHLEWKNITLGVANTTETQVQGLNEGDAVALPSEKPLKNGMVVNAAFQ